MVEVFNILNGIDKADKDQIFQMNTDMRTRGHQMKLHKKQFRLDIRKHTFSQRVINTWNSLPANVVTAESVNQFKGRLNKHWKELSIKLQTRLLFVHSNRTRQLSRWLRVTNRLILAREQGYTPVASSSSEDNCQ